MTKRGNGEGSIYQRTSDDTWVAVINLGWQDGRLRRKYLYGKTRAEVAEKLTRELHQRDRGLPTITKHPTVEQFLTRWLTDVVSPSVRPSTLASYQLHVSRHIVPTIGRLKLVKLEPQHVQTLMNTKLKEGLSPRTVQYMRAVLRKALNHALRWELVARNVATMVDPPRSRKHEITPFSPEQAQTFLSVVSGDRLEALYSVAVALGLRQGEALGLRWSDIDLDRGTLAVRFALQRVNGALALVEPKTQRSRRTITLPTEITAALKRHRVRQLEERLQAGRRWKDGGFVFCTPIGTPLDPRNVVRQFKGFLSSANLPPIRFHDLRHTCATLLLAQGVAPRAIMELLGHSQISLTMDTYSHVLPAMRRETAEAMGRVLFGPSSQTAAMS